MSKSDSRRYRSAGGVVLDSLTNRVLVLLRDGRLAPDGSPEIRLPKGHLKSGEGLRQAALREVREESGLKDLEIIADLGCQQVEFDWLGSHYVRYETCFLVIYRTGTESDQPEDQFKRMWLTWDAAVAKLTYDAEKEWVLRAMDAWQSIVHSPQGRTLVRDD